jgi:hypothetical protein
MVPVSRITIQFRSVSPVDECCVEAVKNAPAACTEGNTTTACTAGMKCRLTWPAAYSAIALQANSGPLPAQDLRASEYCREYDLADPFTILIATGLRRCELLGLRWADSDETAGTLAVRGKVVRGKGLIRMDLPGRGGSPPRSRQRDGDLQRLRYC